MQESHKTYRVYIVLCWTIAWYLPWAQADQV
jgi:hypothetical protein